jgi:glucose-1-phosphate adenylyltransferase
MRYDLLAGWRFRVATISGRVMTVVLGGGRGSRLYPLTAVRAKPAVPLGGKYRLIDIPISNAINSGLREIFVLTQFNSASLNAHIGRTYRFDAFTNGFVEVLAAEQTDSGEDDWYQGTADAVRKHLQRFQRDGAERVLILSGDHLYRMDYADLIRRHDAANADVTVACIPVDRQQCGGFGVMQVDAQGLIRAFKEKPTDDEDLSAIETPGSLREQWGMRQPFLASMGVYVFSMAALIDVLSWNTHDFGKDILPRAIHSHRVAASLFSGYWEDIGTIKSFFEANLSLCDDDSPFRFYDPGSPIFTRARFLPPSIFAGGVVEKSVVAEGCLVRGSRIFHSIIGLRTWISPGAVIEETFVMGADFYELDDKRRRIEAEGGIPVGIGEGASIRRAIIDKNARIGAGAVIHGSPGRPDERHESWSVVDGIVIVAKGATIPAGAVL